MMNSSITIAILFTVDVITAEEADMLSVKLPSMPAPAKWHQVLYQIEDIIGRPLKNIK